MTLNKGPLHSGLCPQNPVIIVFARLGLSWESRTVGLFAKKLYFAKAFIQYLDLLRSHNVWDSYCEIPFFDSGDSCLETLYLDLV